MKTSYRVKKLRETLKILESYKQRAGISRLADISHLDYTGLPVFTAIRPRAKSLSTSQGKGLSKNAAKCSALMEAIEVYYAEHLSPELLNQSMNDLKKGNLPYIAVNALNNTLIYTDETEQINWVKTFSALSGQCILAPFAEFSLNSCLKEVLIYSPNTTGLSGGNTYKEALLHSLLEIIEREPTDSEIEVAPIKNELFNTISSFFEYKVLYKKNNYHIPSFEVWIQAKNPFDNQIIFQGNGCHLNKEIALNRALTEAIQSRTTIIAGSRDDILDSKYEGSSMGWSVSACCCSFSEIPDYSSHDIDSGVQLIYDKARGCNQDIIVYRYHEEDICILKSKIIAQDCIHYV